MYHAPCILTASQPSLPDGWFNKSKKNLTNPFHDHHNLDYCHHRSFIATQLFIDRTTRSGKRTSR